MKPAEKLASLLLEDGFDPEEVERTATHAVLWRDDAIEILMEALRSLGMQPLAIVGKRGRYQKYNLEANVKVGSAQVDWPWDGGQVSFSIRNAITRTLQKTGLISYLDFDMTGVPQLIAMHGQVADNQYPPDTEFMVRVAFVSLTMTESEQIKPKGSPTSGIQDSVRDAGNFLGCTPLVHVAPGEEAGLMEVTAEFPVQLPVWKRQLRLDRWNVVDKLMTALAEQGWVPAGVHSCEVHSMNPLVDMCAVSFTLEGDAPGVKLTEDEDPGFDPEEVEQVAQAFGSTIHAMLGRFKTKLEQLGFQDVRVGVLTTPSPSTWEGKFQTRLVFRAKNPPDQDLFSTVEIRTLRYAAVSSGFDMQPLENILFGSWGVQVRRDEDGYMFSLPVLVEVPIRDTIHIP